MLRSKLYIFFLMALFNSITHSNSFKKLTVLTAPIGVSHQSQSGGPYSVTRSLLNGLKKTGINFNHNPKSVSELGDYLYVPAGINTLHQAISFKKQGLIKKLIAGPNLMTRSNEHNHLLASPEIDIYIVNSKWTYVAYIEDEPSLKHRLHIWPAGVDADFWKPKLLLTEKINHQLKNILVYWKTEPEAFCSAVEKEIRAMGFNPIRIQYGHHSQRDFKELLHEAVCAVFISRSESQGIALAEAWAMDVPTLVWDPFQPLEFAGKKFWPISAAPYLSPETGCFWQSIDDLKIALSSLVKTISNCKPREWIANHMTDEVCAQQLLAIINGTQLAHYY